MPRRQTIENSAICVLAKFDVDALTGAAAMRVARLYGNRPEIHRNASWRALMGLTATTSAAMRPAFEGRIVAGETVKANEILAGETITARRSARLVAPLRQP